MFRPPEQKLNKDLLLIALPSALLLQILCWQKCFHFEVKSIFVAMTFYEKYPQLQEKAFVTEMLTETVFTTMSLEDRQVPKHKVEKIIVSLLAEQELKRSQLNINQIS